MGLLLAGATLAGIVQREKWNIDFKVIAGSVAVRFLVMPVIFILAASLLSFSTELRNVLLVEAAMPAAIFPIVMAKHFGGKPTICRSGLCRNVDRERDTYAIDPATGAWLVRHHLYIAVQTATTARSLL